MKKNQKKLLLREDVAAQGASKFRALKKNVHGYFFPRAMNAHAQVTARKTWAFPEQASCNGVIVMSQRAKGACTVTQAARDGRRLAAVA